MFIVFCVFYRIFSRHESEKRPEDYLRQEYVSRLRKGAVNYRLQIQIHEASPSDTATIFHAGILWDKETHPWYDLATVSIKTPLSPDILERLGIKKLHSALFSEEVVNFCSLELGPKSF